MLDLVIRGGQVVDGKGGPRRIADVGAAKGRIVEVGTIEDSALRTIDAEGLVVAPGFIDIHTHYDAQVFWDPWLSPSCFYGITTVIGGNCGFSVAPIDDEAADYVRRMLARVEGMPLDSLVAGLTWDWTTTAEYLDRVSHQVGINMGFMVGHSAVRRLVMGASSTERPSTRKELEAMEHLVRAGLQAGALGFSSSLGLAHVDWDGAPVPSRHASERELIALAAVCRDFVGTSLEFIPGDVVGLTDEQFQIMASMSTAALRPLNWNLLRITADTRDAVIEDLRGGEVAEGLGGRVVALTMPIPSRARFSFETGFILDVLPGWSETIGLPVAERASALRNPDVRRRLLAGGKKAAKGHQLLADWGSKCIAQGFSPEAQRYEGRLIRDIAAEEGKDDFDALLDIVCADDLRTTFSYAPVDLSEDDWRTNVDVWRGGRAVVGGSDAGAHLDFTAYHDYPAYIVEHAVREHGVLSLEEAVQHMTSVPADLYGLVGRGRLEPGARADVAVFDESTFASGEIRMRFDLPGGAGRLYSTPSGMSHVVVGGVPVVEGGELTGAKGGSVLRGGTDTVTPSLGRPGVAWEDQERSN